jgi:hypothetical protein
LVSPPVTERDDAGIALGQLLDRRTAAALGLDRGIHRGDFGIGNRRMDLLGHVPGTVARL